MADKIDYVASWADRLTSRLFTQYRNKTTWTAWIQGVLAPQFQDLEDAMQSMLAVFDYQNNSGVLLDLVGAYIGQPRLGVDDPTYKQYISGRIIANHSTGTPEELYRLLRALFGATAAPRYLGGYAKQFQLAVTGLALTVQQAALAASFIGAAKEAGARGVFVYRTYPTAQTFTFDVGPGYDVGFFADAIQTA